MGKSRNKPCTTNVCYKNTIALLFFLVGFIVFLNVGKKFPCICTHMHDVLHTFPGSPFAGGPNGKTCFG